MVACAKNKQKSFIYWIYSIYHIIIIIKFIGEEGHWSRAIHFWCLSTFYNSRLLWNHECFMQFQLHYFYDLIFATLWANSANDKSVIYFLLLLFTENKVWHFLQTVPGESLHEMSNLIFSKWVLQSCLLWKLIPFPYYWIMIPGS